MCAFNLFGRTLYLYIQYLRCRSALDMVPFLRKNPEIFQALQRMDNKFMKSNSPLNAVTKLKILFEKCHNPSHASLLRDGFPRPARMLWAIHHIEHLVDTARIAPGELSAPALRGGLLDMIFFKQDVSGARL